MTNSNKFPEPQNPPRSFEYLTNAEADQAARGFLLAHVTAIVHLLHDIIPQLHIPEAPQDQDTTAIKRMLPEIMNYISRSLGLVKLDHHTSAKLLNFGLLQMTRPDVSEAHNSEGALITGLCANAFQRPFLASNALARIKPETLKDQEPYERLRAALATKKHVEYKVCKESGAIHDLLADLGAYRVESDDILPPP